MKKIQKHLITFIIIFYLLNIFNTYFITTEFFNSYVVMFSRKAWGEVNSFVGNIAALTIILVIGFLFIKKVKPRLIYMIIITFILNTSVFALSIFSKYYQTVFSFSELSLFKNPGADLGFTILIEALKSLFVNFKIVMFIPFIILLVYYFVIKRSFKVNDLEFKMESTYLNKGLFNSFVIAGSTTISLLTLSIFNISMRSDWPIFAERSLYGVQNAGLYNYYLSEVFGFDYDDANVYEVDVRTYSEYNKNSESYINFFNEEFSNQLYKHDVDLDFSINPFMDKENLNGIFEDKELVLIHLESFNYFLLNEDGPYLDETYFKTLKKILNESYVIENFYTNVGLGNSSDAEFSVLTGAHPLGNTTMYWEYDNVPYVFEDLATLFEDRYSVAFHGDVGRFYNRQKVYDEMYGFDNYYYFDNKEEYYFETQNGFWNFPDHVNTNLPNEVWLTENDLLEWLKITYDKTAKNQGKKGFYYPILMNPHTPFLYNPTKEEDLRFSKEDIDVSNETLRYLNYETYIEDFFEKFIDLTYKMENTVYIFYGDHGSGISQRDYEEIFGIETNSTNAVENKMKYQQELLKTIAFIYAPDDNDSSLDIKKGLLKGVQPRVRSQVDIYRTIIELFNLETENYYFGVNLLSKEHTFAIDSRNFNIIADDYFIKGKKMVNKGNYTDAYIALTSNPKIELEKMFEYVKRFKNKMDHAIRENAYQHLKR